MRTIFAMLLIANCALVPELAEETDSHHPAGPPGDAKLILENGSVQVLRIRIAPHEKTPMHSFPDGTTREEIRRAGDIEWVPARRHSGENVGETPMDYIAVALKPADPATGAR